MVNNDVIQKNIMLVGTYKDVKKFMKQKNQINIYKCCIISDYDKIM